MQITPAPLPETRTCNVSGTEESKSMALHMVLCKLADSKEFSDGRPIKFVVFYAIIICTLAMSVSTLGRKNHFLGPPQPLPDGDAIFYV